MHTLLLVGHGSHLNAMSSAPVHQHAARIRDEGRYDEVRVGFWKEEPFLCRALDGCDADRVTIVPVFICGGYFTDEVVPRELKLAGPPRERRVPRLDAVTRRTKRGGQWIDYTSPVGAHPDLVDVMIQRAEDVGANHDTDVVVLGHGTARNLTSAENIHLQSNRLRDRHRFASVESLFLDQEPGIGRVWEITKAPEVVVVPLFVADGWHVAETIPDDLDLVGGENQRGERHLRFAGAVGTHPTVVRVIHALVGEAGRGS